MADRFKTALAAGASAAALLTGCATTNYAIPSVTAEQVARVQVPEGQVATYNRTDDQNRLMLGTVFARLQQAAAPICQQNGVDCSRFSIAYANKDVVNAFASNGTQITVNSGLMKYTSEPELAAVVAHEMSHHIARHGENTMQRAQVGGTIGAVLLGALAAKAGVDPNMGAQIGAGLGQVAAVLPYSKDQERQADYVAGYILARAGYNLRSAGNVWNTLAKLSGGGNKPSGMLATHPSSGERIVAWQQTVAEVETSPTKLPRRSGPSP